MRLKRSLAVALLALVAAVIPGVASASGVDISATEGQSFTKRVATISGCTLGSAGIIWGDGKPNSAGQLDSTGGTSGIKGTHTYDEAGVYNGKVSYTCSESSGTQTALFQATVQDAPLTASGRDVSGTAGQTLTGIVAHFSDANPGAPVSDFSAQISWGDGGNTSGTVTAAPGGGFDVSGTHTYAGAGTYAVSTGIADVDAGTANASSAARIAPGSTAPGGPGAGPRASFTYQPALPCRGQDVSFDASASTSSVPINEYRWSFAGVTTHRRRGAPKSEHFPDPPQLTPPSSSPRFSRSFGVSNFQDTLLGYFIALRPPVQASLEVVDSLGRTASVTQTISFQDPTDTIVEGSPTDPACLQRSRFAAAALSDVASVSRGSAYASLFCAGATDCGGVLSVVVSARSGRAVLGARRRRRATKTLGRAGFVIPGGRKSVVRVPLNRRGRALARARRLRRATLRLKSRGRNGKAVVRSKRVRLRRR